MEPSVPAPHRTYNILVIEDNPADAYLIREAFHECGHHCLLSFVHSPENALEVLEAQPFDFVISDMGVHNDSCARFIRSVRGHDRLKTMPIIVLSGSSNSRPAYEAGANAFISKTIDMDQLFKKISALMHFWVEIAELPHSLN